MQFSTSYARPVLPNIIIMYWLKRRTRAARNWGARLGGRWGRPEGPALRPPPPPPQHPAPALGGPAPSHGPLRRQPARASRGAGARAAGLGRLRWGWRGPSPASWRPPPASLPTADGSVFFWWSIEILWLSYLKETLEERNEGRMMEMLPVFYNNYS